MTQEQIQEIRYLVGEAWKGAYNPTTVYGNANVVQDTEGLSVYRSLKPGNSGHPLTDQQWWFKIIDMSSIKALYDQMVEGSNTMAENELGRVAAEQSRVSAEQSRVNAENARIYNENQRINDETTRVRAEQDRVTQENQRISQEQGRVGAEQQRVAKEQQRVNQEASRVAAETQRQLNENDRQAVFAEDHAVAVADHQQADQDHTRAEADHEIAVQDNAQITALVERADADHVQAGQDHTRAESDHTTAANDHTQAGSDHTRAGQDHTQAGNDHTRAEEDHAASVTATEAANAAAAGANALQENLENGLVIPAVTNDIASWKNTNSKVVDTQTKPVFTAGGNESVNSNENAKIISIAPGSLTAGAASLVSTGFNLLRNATQIGSGQVWYFLVPYLKFGTYGTADENNGVLFTGSDNGKLTPTVYWKALADGVPTSATDGVAAGYTDSNGYRFYTTPAGHEGEVGYFIVQATRATTCAHVAWSGRYDEYIAVDNAGDAGASLALTSILNNLHSNGLMYNIGLVADSVGFTATTAYWTRNCDRKQGSDLTWTNTLQEDNETYLHTATIADMLDDSAVVCTNENINLVVSGKEVSYTDTNEAAFTTDYLYYQLATAVTGTVAGTYSFVIEDWGVIYFTGVNGTVVSIIEYSQNIVDTLRKLATTGFNDAMRVIAESLNQLAAENVRLKTYAERLEARIEALES